MQSTRLPRLTRPHFHVEVVEVVEAEAEVKVVHTVVPSTSGTYRGSYQCRKVRSTGPSRFTGPHVLSAGRGRLKIKKKGNVEVFKLSAVYGAAAVHEAACVCSSSRACSLRGCRGSRDHIMMVKLIAVYEAAAVHEAA